MKRMSKGQFLPDLARRILLRYRRQRGSIMVLTSVMITGMVGMMALAIDLGFLFSARNQFQNGIDSAALAGAAGLRVTIESDSGMPQQLAVAQQLAVQYAGFNQVRRYTDPDPDSTEPNSNNIVLDPSAVSVDRSTDLPKVLISTSMQTPMLFAGMFGFNTIDMNAISSASLLPVDGGTGTIGGCWRPLFLPDTFFDGSSTVHYAGEAARGANPLPDQAGDYYRSRFAVGARNVQPYIDAILGVGPSVTGLRDTEQINEVGVSTIMGQYVEFRRDYYRIANFSGLPRATFDVLSTDALANFGYCGQIRVGDDIPVFAFNDFTAYDQVKVGLESLKYRTNDSVDNSLKLSYRYIKSASYPGPNSHAAIIPVLLFNPLELVKNPGANILKVTNIGLFFLEEVRSDGTLYGLFVREVIAGGTTIDSTNFGADSFPTFKRSWLPMSVQILK